MFIAPSMNFGGAERVMSILANELVEKDYAVSVILTQSPSQSSYRLNEKVVLESISERLPKRGMPHFYIMSNLRKIFKTERPDCVICFFNDVCALTALALMGLSIPLIYSERNDPNRTNQRKVEKMYRKIVEHLSSGFVFQTDGAKQCYKGSIQARSAVILNPMEIERIPIRAEVPLWDIITVGRLTEQKRQDVLIDAFSEVVKLYPQYRLKIYGDGELKENLENKIEQLGLSGKAFLCGTDANVLSKVAYAEIFVLTSDYEGIPNALIEAMAIGLPCISTDCSPGGARMLIQDGENGWIVPCGDSKMIARRLVDAIENQEASRKIGDAAKKIRDRVNSQAISFQWTQYIERVINGE